MNPYNNALPANLRHLKEVSFRLSNADGRLCDIISRGADGSQVPV